MIVRETHSSFKSSKSLMKSPIKNNPKANLTINSNSYSTKSVRRKRNMKTVSPLPRSQTHFSRKSITLTRLTVSYWLDPRSILMVSQVMTGSNLGTLEVNPSKN